nr:glycoside hydrolase family 1 [Phyllotreta armoraciae]
MGVYVHLSVLFLIFCSASTLRGKNNGRFPRHFKFGVATSSYQSEGSWNQDGKGPSIWDNFTHTHLERIVDRSNADVSVDFYHRYKEDIALAASLGVKAFRFSFAWPRIFPTGYNTTINQKGVQFYKNLIREILKYNMIPVGTIYHWDLPLQLYNDGIDWNNPKIVNYIVEYARYVIKTFPEVGIWISINEPHMLCHMGYGLGSGAPGIIGNGKQEYMCAYLTLKSIGAIYRMYKKEFPHYKAKMAPALDCQWIESLSNSTENKEAAERQRQFECGMYYHPIFVGDWPPVVKERVEGRRIRANITEPRLPQFTQEEIKNIKGSADFIGLNHYFTVLAADLKEADSNVMSYDNDVGIVNSFKPSWIVQNNGFFSIVPKGVRKLLNWLKKSYGDHEILFTELGMTENGTSLEDDIRIDFYHDYMCNILSAINEDGVNVSGILAWSNTDSFEWTSGYTSHFGIIHIDINDPNKTRTPKKSAGFFRKLTRTRKLHCEKPNRKWPGPFQWIFGKPRFNRRTAC